MLDIRRIVGIGDPGDPANLHAAETTARQEARLRRRGGMRRDISRHETTRTKRTATSFSPLHSTLSCPVLPCPVLSCPPPQFKQKQKEINSLPTLCNPLGQVKSSGTEIDNKHFLSSFRSVPFHSVQFLFYSVVALVFLATVLSDGLLSYRVLLFFFAMLHFQEGSWKRCSASDGKCRRLV